MHWKYNTKPDLTKFGFVYCITNTKTGQAYIGCKQYFNYKKGKKKAESNWKSYMGSSTHLLEDIKKLGKTNFKFEMIAEFKNKRSLRYYECYYQMKYNVLCSKLDGTDTPADYNNYVGGKSEDSSVQVYRDQAHSWIFKDVGVTCEDFEEICFYAGLEPTIVRKFAMNVINSEDITHVRRKFQALL